MNIFLSWSGERSKHIAASLKEWLPSVIQAIEPWMSDRDISAGQKWGSVLSEKLSQCLFGIICVTPENNQEPWLYFEAGAISKAVLSETFVCPYLFDLEPEQLKGPLAQFQIKRANKQDTRDIVFSINNKLENKVGDTQLRKTFDIWWPDFEERLKQCPKINTVKPTRSLEDMIVEILQNTRDIRINQVDPIAGRKFEVGDRIEFLHRPGRVAKITKVWEPDDAAKEFPSGVKGGARPPYIDGVVEATFEGFDTFGRSYPKEIAAGTTVIRRSA